MYILALTLYCTYIIYMMGGASPHSNEKLFLCVPYISTPKGSTNQKLLIIERVSYSGIRICEMKWTSQFVYTWHVFGTSDDSEKGMHIHYVVGYVLKRFIKIDTYLKFTVNYYIALTERHTIYWSFYQRTLDLGDIALSGHLGYLRRVLISFAHFTWSAVFYAMIGITR